MRIRRVKPEPAPPPPIEVEMRFDRDEALAVRAALVDWVNAHPAAADRDKWIGWTKELERAMRP